MPICPRNNNGECAVQTPPPPAALRDCLFLEVEQIEGAHSGRGRVLGVGGKNSREANLGYTCKQHKHAHLLRLRGQFVSKSRAIPTKISSSPSQINDLYVHTHANAYRHPDIPPMPSARQVYMPGCPTKPETLGIT